MDVAAAVAWGVVVVVDAGVAGAEVVAHEEFAEEQRYLTELQPYFHYRNRTLFPFIPEEPPKLGLIAYGGVEPTRTVRNGEPYRFEQGDLRFEVLGARKCPDQSLRIVNQYREMLRADPEILPTILQVNEGRRVVAPLACEAGLRVLAHVALQ